MHGEENLTVQVLAQVESFTSHGFLRPVPDIRTHVTHIREVVLLCVIGNVEWSLVCCRGILVLRQG